MNEDVHANGWAYFHGGEDRVVDEDGLIACEMGLKLPGFSEAIAGFVAEANDCGRDKHLSGVEVNGDSDVEEFDPSGTKGGIALRESFGRFGVRIGKPGSEAMLVDASVIDVV